MGICVSCRRRERKPPKKRSVPGAGEPAKGTAAAELLPRRVNQLTAMAYSMSNIKMTNPIKGIVSQRRKRYIKDGFNLDLAYITDRLIAMGFPAEKLEGVYRNHIDEVYRFLEKMHKDHYKIYNLCSERSYDSSKFHERILVALAFYASGSYQTLVGQLKCHSLSQPSVSRAMHQVTEVLNLPHIFNKYVSFPITRADRENVKREFFNKFKMPGVLGCIDGTHVAIVTPSEHEERYYSRKGYHSLNTLIVARYALEDHTPPNMELIQPFCEDVHNWLSADPKNVAAVHCKAGKGRTGTMVCCYLLYSGQKATADEALKFYGTKRAHDEKGVTIPSQRRYVEYYASLINSRLQYTATKVHIRELVMSPPPMLNGGQCSPELTVSQAQPSFKTPPGYEVHKDESCIRVYLTQCTPLHGDVRVDVFNKPKMKMRKEKLFHFWFNTFFVTAELGAQRLQPLADSPSLEAFKLTLNKWQLDEAHKDKQHKHYSQDFKVELIVQKMPSTSTFLGAGVRAASPASSSSSCCSEPDTEPDAHWDSGESTYL